MYGRRNTGLCMVRQRQAPDMLAAQAANTGRGWKCGVPPNHMTSEALNTSRTAAIHVVCPSAYDHDVVSPRSLFY